MANGATGEVTFTHDGKTYRLVFGMAAIAAFEDETDMSVLELAQRLSPQGGGMPKLSTIGSLLSAALSTHHPEVDRIAAMELLSEPDVMQALVGGFNAAMPAGDGGKGEGEQGEGGDDARPPKGRSGRKARTGKA